MQRKDNDKAKKAEEVVRAYVSDSCIIADEPFYMPVSAPKDGDTEARAKFLPLIGLVIGKLAELYINNKIKNSANHYKAGVARKDTRYATSAQMNLYRARLRSRTRTRDKRLTRLHDHRSRHFQTGNHGLHHRLPAEDALARERRQAAAGLEDLADR